MTPTSRLKEIEEFANAQPGTVEGNTYLHLFYLIARVKRLTEALESAKSCFSCIRHNCKPDAFMLALDIGSQVVMKHIDYSEDLARKALEEE